MTNSTDRPHVVFLSPIAEALHNRRLGISQTTASELLFGYSVLFRRFQRSLHRSLESLQKYNDRRTEEIWRDGSKGSSTDHIYEFIDATYTASELFEFYETDIIDVLHPNSPTKAAYRTAIRQHKRFSTLICNRCKHNHAFPQGIEIEYEGGHRAACFSLYKMRKTAIVLDEEIHRKEPCFSLNWALRRVITDVLIADMEASSMIRSIPDKGTETILTLEHKLPILKEYHTIAKLPIIGAPLETRAIKLHEGANNVVEMERLNEPPFFGGNGKLRAFIDIIPPSLSFFLPYIKEPASVSLQINRPAGGPLPMDMRVIVGNVEVFDGLGASPRPQADT